MVVLTEPVVHREELLLVPDQYVCAPPENEKKNCIICLEDTRSKNVSASQNMGSKLIYSPRLMDTFKDDLINCAIEKCPFKTII